MLVPVNIKWNFCLIQENLILTGTYVVIMVMDFYDVKQNPKYAYRHVIGNQSHYTYSQHFVEFVVEEIKKNPEGFVNSLKRKEKR